MNLLSAYCQRLPGHIYCEDALAFFRAMPDDSVDAIVTSPPYWKKRDYGVSGQLGQEADPREFVQKLTLIFHEAQRVLKSTGTCWIVIDDTRTGSGNGGNPTDSRHRKQATNVGSLIPRVPVPTNMKAKDSALVPERLIIALQDDGWYIRNKAIWHKNAMPESMDDRLTHSYENLFFITKSPDYYFNAEIIQEIAVSNVKNKDIGRGKQKYAIASGMGKHPQRDSSGGLGYVSPGMRNMRDVWYIPNEVSGQNHHATFPRELVERCLLAGCPVGGVCCDPFMGAGTTAIVAVANHRQYIGCDINPVYIEMANTRPTEIKLPMFAEVAAREPQAVTAPLFEEK